MIKLPRTTRQWIRGLVGAFIGGLASAGSAWMGMATAHYAGLEVPELNFNALIIICASGGLTSLFAFLAKSPVPPDCEDPVSDRPAAY